MLAGWMGLLLSACLGGSFAVPGKRLQVMSWDAAWLIFCVVSQILIPCLLGLLFAAPIFARVFPQHLPLVASLLAIGALWGIGALLYGASIPRLGIALTNAIVNGCVALLGSLGPLLMSAESLQNNELAVLLIGLMLLTAGIAASCWASLLRDRSIAQQEAAPAVLGLTGIFVALLSGCLSSVLNIGFVYGKPLIDYSVKQGVDETASTLSVWIPLLAGGFVVNALATNLRLVRAGEYPRMASSPVSDWLRASAMGVLWASAILIYGLSSRMLGKAGTVYGWAVMSGAGIFISTVWGLWLGEWTQAAGRARKWLFISLGLMLCSFFLISIGKR